MVIDFGTHRWPVAAKNHHCEWCGEPITKGTPHYYFTGVWKGEWQNWRMHTECHEAADKSDDALIDGFSPYENPRPEPGGVNV